MKEATGELNMTVVTLIAIAAIGALFYFVIWPTVQRMVVDQTCKTYGTGWHAQANGEGNSNTGSSAQVSEWLCCPEGQTTVADGCIETN